MKPEFHAKAQDAHLREVKKAHRPILINLWAPPGVGKSSNMAAIFNILKFKGLRVEMSPEVAKRHTYENNRMAMSDQFYVTACQEYLNFLLVGSVDFIVTDSPPGLGLLFCQQEDWAALYNLCQHYRRRYVNVDIRLVRDTSRTFQTYGRNHTEVESKAMDLTLDDLLARFTNQAVHRLADNSAAADIVAFVEREVAPYADIP